MLKVFENEFLDEVLFPKRSNSNLYLANTKMQNNISKLSTNNSALTSKESKS